MKKVKAISTIGFIVLIVAMMITPAVAQTLTCPYDICVNETGWWRDGGAFNAVGLPIYNNMGTGALGNANDGDTVFVYNGTYLNIYLMMLTSNVTLIGEDVPGGVTLSFDGTHSLKIEAAGCVVSGFKIVNSPGGVRVGVQAPNCIVRNCVFDGMTGSEALRLDACNITFENNVVSNTPETCKYYALRIKDDSCTIINNTFINITKGAAICLHGKTTLCENNVITRNNISLNSGKCGIWIYYLDSGNKIYLNDFVDNTAGVTYSGTPPAVTYWNSTEQIDYVYGGSTYTNYLGNYWSPQYTGTDADSDGIGDTAYPIPGSATDKDYRPLMAGYENYPEPSKPDLDLIPTAITAPALFAGVPSTITATIANTGTVDAGSFNVSLSADGTPVDTATVDSLNGGMSTNVSFQWTPTSAGEYELCVLADCDDSVNEVDETNNEMCIEVEIKPDLTTTEVTTAELLLLNQSSVVNASIANIGNADADSFNVSLSANGTVVDTANVESLGAGNVTNVSFQWMPSSVGEVELCVAADSDGTIDELNETNNDKCVVVTVHAPDLVPTAMTPDAFFPGKPNTVTATVENIGDAEAGSFNVALSANGAVVDTASVDGLAGGASTEVSFSWTATVGDHELCVLADSDSEVDESDETNNELCKDVTVYPNTVYLVPKDSGAPYCCEAEVEVWVEAEDGFQGGQINLTYSLDCANVTGVEFNPVWDFESATWWDTYEGYTRISFAKSVGTVSGDVWIGNLMIHCTSEDIDTLCSTTLSYATVTKLVNDFGTEVKANWIEGTFGCDLAKVRIEPETLNLKSKGVFTAFITLPEPYDVADINVSTVECEGAQVVNYNIIPGKDTLRVKFDREDLRKDLPTGDAVTMRVTGEMQTGKIFEGHDTIRVIAKGQ